MGKSTDMNCI